MLKFGLICFRSFEREEVSSGTEYCRQTDDDNGMTVDNLSVVEKEKKLKYEAKLYNCNKYSINVGINLKINYHVQSKQ